jgi:hypothetical protein
VRVEKAEQRLRPAPLVLVVLPRRPPAIRIGSITSATNGLLASSMHTNGSSSDGAAAYTSSTSSILATNRAESFSGMHQHSFRHGRRSFF